MTKNLTATINGVRCHILVGKKDDCEVTLWVSMPDFFQWLEKDEAVTVTDVPTGEQHTIEPSGVIV